MLCVKWALNDVQVDVAYHDLRLNSVQGALMAILKGDQDRAAKSQAILAAARSMFLHVGYEKSAMSRIAEQAGVAPNTIYWYFEDKDVLLIAVLNELFSAALRAYELRKDGPLEEQVLWLVEELEAANSLIATVHARVLVSASVRAWHRSFHTVLENMLVAQLRARGVPEGELGHASRAAMFALEGLLSHPSPAQERRALLAWLVAKVLPSSSPALT
jgi:AcrR family transcriptional regulator